MDFIEYLICLNRFFVGSFIDKCGICDSFGLIFSVRGMCVFFVCFFVRNF